MTPEMERGLLETVGVLAGIVRTAIGRIENLEREVAELVRERELTDRTVTEEEQRTEELFARVGAVEDALGIDPADDEPTRPGIG